MAIVFYNAAKAAILKAEIDLEDADIRAILCMTNTTAGTENDGKVYVGDLTTLDEADGANYVRKALANEAVTKVDASDHAKWSSDAATWSALGVGTRNSEGILFYKHVTSDADSPIIGYLPFTSSVVHDGTDFTVTPHANGWFYNA